MKPKTIVVYRVVAILPDGARTCSGRCPWRDGHDCSLFEVALKPVTTFEHEKRCIRAAPCRKADAKLVVEIPEKETEDGESESGITMSELLDRYRGNSNRLAQIRYDINYVEDTDDENSVMDEMDELWDQLSKEEKATLRTEGHFIRGYEDDDADDRTSNRSS